MGTLLIFLFLLALIAIIIVLSVIGSFVNILLSPFRGWGRKRGHSSRDDRGDNPSASSKPREDEKRIFDKNEGEYVDFEEIKEDKKE